MMAAAIAAMTLGELLGPAAGAHAALAVTDLVSDSRLVTPGAAFVALAGERSHGLDYAAAAQAAGAVIVLYEAPATPESIPEPGLPLPELGARLGELGRRFYGRDMVYEELIGVTGTNGKTTVAWLAAQALTSLDQPCGYIGTLGFGLPGALRPQALTTPDCLTLHRELAELGTSRAAIEVSSHALTQERIAGLDFSVAAFTNLSRDHLDWHGTMDAYFEAKARLFGRPGLRAAVVNSRDAYGEILLGRLAPDVRPVAVALADGDHAMITARAASQGLDGLVLRIGGALGEAEIESRLIGEFNAENLLVALGILVACGHDLDAAATALSAAAPAPGRMEVFGGPPEQPWVVVDYAHTPQALERVLAGLTTMATGELTCVFGCGGDRDRGKRALMGAAAARYAQHIVLTNDNPRGEDPTAIIADIKSGITRHPDLRSQPARDRAIAEAIAAAAAGDVVLIAGKGHETAQLIDGEAIPFDDRARVCAALRGRS
jgi:UDP-N-acetylmuramoyl-L-alanyl-D-glutamate--2,6-diaminopimelate ligase